MDILTKEFADVDSGNLPVAQVAKHFGERCGSQKGPNGRCLGRQNENRY